MSNKVTVPLTKDALLKSYRKRLKDDVTSMISNFTEIIKLCKIEEPNQISRPAECEEDAFEMQVRAANMVRTQFTSQSELHFSCSQAFVCHQDIFKIATTFPSVKFSEISF